MTAPFYKDNHITIFNKDCRDMSELPDESVQCVVTSPPYWGLRKYSGDQGLIWGGDNHCGHQWGTVTVRPAHPDRSTGDQDPKGSGIFVDRIARGAQPAKAARGQAIDSGSFCSLCGAWKGAFGLEPTPEMYVQHTIEMLREIRRVLRKDGVVFWNIGDSYGSGKGTCFNPGGGKGSFSGHGDRKDAGAYPLDRGNVSMLKASGLKPKDLCLIPFRIAIAAQEDGWWVRSVIIWSKNNPMPQSVKDRPTVSHEYVLMLTKSARYFWDQEAVREQSISTSFGADQRDTSITHGIGGGNSGINEAKRRAREAGTFGSRNLRSVWTFPTRLFPNIRIDGRKVGHFAVFPEKLPELCIKAATPEEGCCSKCGAPWARVTERGVAIPTGHGGSKQMTEIIRQYRGEKSTETSVFSTGEIYPTKTIGWRPTCNCNAEKVPSLVLDPLMGAGTTLLVAKKLNRYACGYELSEEYCQLAVERCRQQVIL